MNSLSNQPIKSIRNIFVFLIICFCVLAVNPLKAQETGPLLMKQQLGYTLAGGVAGLRRCDQCRKLGRSQKRRCPAAGLDKEVEGEPGVVERE